MVRQPLYRPLPQSVTYAGRRYRLRPSFDRVLDVMDAYQRNDLDDVQKVDYAVWLLVRGAGRLPIAHKAQLLDVVYRDLIDTGARKTDGPKAFDFLQDAPYIYAGFRQAYGIDLFAQQGRLHWWAFVHLFSALPEGTRMMEIISIRTRPLPKPTKYNAAERQALMRAKAAYRLELPQEERTRQFAAGLQRMAAALGGVSNG